MNKISINLLMIFFTLVFTANAQESIQIGSQTWMKKNLDTDRFANGELIPEAKTDEEWKAAGENQKPAWCYYANDSANGAKYGRLYNWYAVADSRRLCPTGWHVPSDAEWTILETILGGTSVAGGAMKAVSSLWCSPNTGATNSSGFTAFPGGNNQSGNHYYAGAAFYRIGKDGLWWSSSEYSSNHAWSRGLYYNYALSFRVNDYKTKGFSVRCLRD